jgi:hypothetical protein
MYHVLRICLVLALILSWGHMTQAQDDFGLPETGLDDVATTNPIESHEDEVGGSQAGSESPVEGGIAPGMDEPEQIDHLANRFKFKPIRASKDPFKPLVQKPMAQIPVIDTRVKQNTGPVPPPPPPPPPPIQISVQGIVGNDSERLALILFENKPYTVQRDTVVDGKFKVVEILPDRLVVYSNREQMRRTFNMAPGKD